MWWWSLYDAQAAFWLESWLAAGWWERGQGLGPVKASNVELVCHRQQELCQHWNTGPDCQEHQRNQVKVSDQWKLTKKFGAFLAETNHWKWVKDWVQSSILWNFWQKWNTTITQRAPKETRSLSLALLWALQIGKVEHSNQTLAYSTSKVFITKPLSTSSYAISSIFEKGIRRWQIWALHHWIVWWRRKRARNKEKDIMSTWPRMWN